MPIKDKEQYELFKAAEQNLQGRLNSLAERPDMTPDNPEYLKLSGLFDRYSRAINTWEESQRQVDDKGKVIKAPTARQTRLPSTFTPEEQQQPKRNGPPDYFYEPTVSEAIGYVKSNPRVLTELGLAEWAPGIARPETAEPVADPGSGAPMGQTVNPEVTFLDALTADSDEYKRIAEHMWGQRVNRARERGESVSRYRDVDLAKNPVDYLHGGAGYFAEKYLTPFAMNAANSMTAGQASRGYDAALDLVEHETSTQDTPLSVWSGGAGQQHPPTQFEFEQEVTDPLSGRSVGSNVVQNRPANVPTERSADIESRSPLAYTLGGFYGYGLPGNPINAAQGLVSRGLNYGARSATENLGKSIAKDVGRSALAGATGNALEGFIQETGDAANRGVNPLDAARQAAGNIPANAAFGAIAGAGGDLVAQGAGGVREVIRSRNPEIRVLQEAGGDTNPVFGVTAPPEIHEHIRQSNRPGARGRAEELAAEEIVPQIRKSFEEDTAAERRRIEQQDAEYFSHPDYANIEVSNAPLIDLMLEMAEEGRFRTSYSNQPRQISQEKIRDIAREISTHGELVKVPKDEARQFANERGGRIINSEIAQELYGEGADWGQHSVGVIVPSKMTARKLHELESHIDGIMEASYGKAKAKRSDDPVYRRFNLAAKALRDEFPYYTDEAGNLVSPPGPESAPFAPASDLPQGEGVKVMGKPLEVGTVAPQPEAKPGIGPGRPRMPETFDRREPAQRPVPIQPQPTRGVVEPPPRIQEAEPGVGPGQPQLDGPFDPRSRVQHDPAIQPQGTRSVVEPPKSVAEAEMGIGPLSRVASPLTDPFSLTYEVVPPQDIDIMQRPRSVVDRPPRVQEAEPGVGPGVPDVPSQPFNLTHEIVRSQAIESLPRPQPVVDRPPNIEPAPRTPPMPSGRPLTEEATPLSLLSGNKLAMEAPSARPNDGNTEPLRPNDGNTEPTRPANSEQVRNDADWQEQQVLHAAEAYENGMKPVMDENGAVVGVQPMKPDEMADQMVLRLAKRIRARKAEEARGKADESLPAPSPREWRAADQEGRDFEDAVFSPGREARAADSDRVAKMAEHQQAMEEALGQINDIDRRLGPIEPKQKEEMLLDYISRKLGRTVTREDLVKAGILAGGAAIAATTDNEDDDAVVAAASLVGGGKGKKGKRPKQLEATLEDGTPVKGFSALRRKQHLALKEIEERASRAGADGDKTLTNRAIKYNQPGSVKQENDALFEQAEKLGLGDKLRTTAATNVFRDLRNRSFFPDGRGILNYFADAGGIHAEKMLELLSGAERNPFARNASGPLENLIQMMLADPARRILNVSGGAAGARHGDDLQDIIEALRQQETEAQRYETR